mmetsp:Transcript_5772/g.13802  ORF Transcript_5772/g.13802 Transcript_5772/m.13802 type:complete len:127 (+) Transcript_5772:99-479(+)
MQASQVRRKDGVTTPWWVSTAQPVVSCLEGEGREREREKESGVREWGARRAAANRGRQEGVHPPTHSSQRSVSTEGGHTYTRSIDRSINQSIRKKGNQHVNQLTHSPTLSTRQAGGQADIHFAVTE